jgi:hypothetical protein
LYDEIPAPEQGVGRGAGLGGRSLVIRGGEHQRSAQCDPTNHDSSSSPLLHAWAPPTIPLRVFFNTGSGRSFSPIDFGDGKGTAYGFAIADLDEDGRLDIAMARSAAPNVVYFAGPDVTTRQRD